MSGPPSIPSRRGRSHRLINKVVATFDEAVADMQDGATIHFGGFASPFNTPSYLVAAVARRGVTGLTAISTSMGRGVKHRDSQSPWLPPELRPLDFFDVALMAELGQLKKGITTFAVGARHDLIYPFEERLAEGSVEVEVLGQGSLAERIRCARAGIAAFYTPVGPGTDVANGKEVRDFDGVPHVLETALHADFALIRAWKADRYGNLIFRGPRSFNETMAGAARITIAEVDEVVPLGDLKPEQIHTAGIYVQRVVVRPSAPVTSWEVPQ